LDFVFFSPLRYSTPNVPMLPQKGQIIDLLPIYFPHNNSSLYSYFTLTVTYANKRKMPYLFQTSLKTF